MSRDSKEITIIQYNTNHSKDKVQTPSLQQMRPEEHHIIAIQEPWINTRSKKTITHPGYHTILPDYPHPRTAIYVSKEIATTSWEAISYSGDLATFRALQPRWTSSRQPQQEAVQLNDTDVHSVLDHHGQTVTQEAFEDLRLQAGVQACEPFVAVYLAQREEDGVLRAEETKDLT